MYNRKVEYSKISSEYGLRLKMKMMEKIKCRIVVLQYHFREYNWKKPKTIPSYVYSTEELKN